MTDFEPVIGLEVHIQVKTRTKMFCSCPNDFGAEPNMSVCPICMGHPGTLPVPNAVAIRKTVKAGLVLGCRIAEHSKFDRKSYFYPDMPKNYQISQYDMPLCIGGGVEIGGGKGFSGMELPRRTVALTRIHLEEDVGKSTHFAKHTGLDFNRAGVPLMEIVSEPDIFTPDEAYAYLVALQQSMRYADIGPCDMEKGQMRCDVNISVRPKGEKELGVKIELKNLNSFRSVHLALQHEIKRQAEVLNSGGTLRQETRGWDDDAGGTYLMRVKENTADYRYFPCPDLMPLHLSKEFIDGVRAELPELPDMRRARFVQSYAVTPYDAEVLASDRALGDWFDAAAKSTRNPKLLANWVITELLRELSDAKTAISDCRIQPSDLAAMVDLIEDKTISGKTAKDVFGEMFQTGAKPSDIVQAKGLHQVTDDSAIEELARQVVQANPTQVQQYRDGKTAVLQFLVGQLMKLSKGKANPQLAVSKIKDALDS